MRNNDRLNNEFQLIRSAKAGDKQAFGLLYEFYSQKLLKYMYFRTSNMQISEDLVANVFLKAWENLPRFGKRKQGNNFRAWLFSIGHNVLIDFYRAQKHDKNIDNVETSNQDTPDTYHVVKMKEEHQQLLSAIKDLNDISQIVLINRFLAGLSHRETAEILGLTEGNVRIIQYRALKKLKKILGSRDV